MSEQKMPALPDADDHFCGDLYWNQDSVERIQREAYEACDRQWRERLEPLRVAVEALNKAQANEAAIRSGITTCDKPLRAAHESYAAASTVIATARTLLESDR